MGQIRERYDHQQHRDADGGKNVKDGRPFEINQRDDDGGRRPGPTVAVISFRRRRSPASVFRFISSNLFCVLNKLFCWAGMFQSLKLPRDAAGQRTHERLADATRREHARLRHFDDVVRLKQKVRFLIFLDGGYVDVDDLLVTRSRESAGRFSHRSASLLFLRLPPLPAPG